MRQTSLERVEQDWIAWERLRRVLSYNNYSSCNQSFAGDKTATPKNDDDNFDHHLDIIIIIIIIIIHSIRQGRYTDSGTERRTVWPQVERKYSSCIILRVGQAPKGPAPNMSQVNKLFHYFLPFTFSLFVKPGDKPALFLFLFLFLFHPYYHLPTCLLNICPSHIYSSANPHLSMSWSKFFHFPSISTIYIDIYTYTRCALTQQAIDCFLLSIHHSNDTTLKPLWPCSISP